MTSRIHRLRTIYDNDCALLISDPLNIRYLCGFTGSFGYLLLNQDDAILFTDSRYDIQSRQETSEIQISIGRNLIDFLREHCSHKTLLIEGNHMSVSLFNEISLLQNVSPHSSLGLVEKIRMVKDETELHALSRAGEITTAALTQLINSEIRGLTELQIAHKLERLMIDCGAEAIAFDTIVASGPNSAIPHHHPTNRIITEGDFLKIDFGAQFAGYKSDCTRTFVIGQPTHFHTDLYTEVRQAQQIGRNTTKAGVLCSDIDNSVREALNAHLHGATFQHGLGHGVGLAIHEDPFLSAKNDTRLASGTVVTIEPGMYVESRGGVRIEDTIVVTDDGYINLTDFSYDLISL